MVSNNKKEIEIKFRLDDPRSLVRKLRAAGFRCLTRRKREINTLYDRPGLPLRKSGALLRLRNYAGEWLLTHKAKGKAGRHKTRAETETKVNDGEKMEAILRALAFRPTFRYEKMRAEWSDGKGHVVVDETPIGNFGEIEGPPGWIDRTARLLDISRDNYITKSYGELFSAWKRRSRSHARDMTFRALGRRPPTAR